MARQIRPGQLQENVLYNISASYAVTASYAMNGGSAVSAGTVSGSEQISALGFVTSSATASFITNSQTASMSVATASYVTSAQSSSYILAANIDQPFTTVSAAGILNTGGDNFNIAGNGDDVVISTGTSAFVVESEAQFKDSVNIDLASNSQLIVSGGRVDLRNALGVSGSFSGSFEGDGSQLTGISTTPFPFTGDAQITGSLTLSGSSPLLSLPNAPRAAMIISGSNDRTRLHIYDTEDNTSPTYTEGAGIVLTGGEGSAQAILEISAVGSTNGGSKKQYKSISIRTQKLKKRRPTRKKGDKRPTNGGGSYFSKSKPQYIIKNNTENEGEKNDKPCNVVTFNPTTRKRKSYCDKYDIDNISDNSEEEEIADKSIKRKRKNGKKWSTRGINKSHRSVDLQNRIILNNFKKTMDDENLINWTTGKITREEYNTKEEEIKKQTKIGGRKNLIIKSTRKRNKLRSNRKKTKRI